MTTGFVWDERFAWFNAGHNRRRGPFYSPMAAYDTRESKERIRELLVASGLADRLVPIAPRLATDQELLRFHTPEYVAKVRALSDGEGGDAGEGAYLGRNCYDIARLSAGAALEALDAVLDGRVHNAYALVRPCGHHATRDFGRGFSIFGNIVLAILDAKARGKARKVAVIDWDVHHGNGTQDAFYADPTVLTISLHQAGYYPPDSGWLAENGDGPGRGYNINVPLPAGSGHGAYVETMRQVVLPALQRFHPDVIMVVQWTRCQRPGSARAHDVSQRDLSRDGHDGEDRCGRTLWGAPGRVSRRRIRAGLRTVVRAGHPGGVRRYEDIVPGPSAELDRQRAGPGSTAPPG
jgi:acetoin utilization deacetylase AcuC-like enzyme